MLTVRDAANWMLDLPLWLGAIGGLVVVVVSWIVVRSIAALGRTALEEERLKAERKWRTGA